MRGRADSSSATPAGADARTASARRAPSGARRMARSVLDGPGGVKRVTDGVRASRGRGFTRASHGGARTRAARGTRLAPRRRMRGDEGTRAARIGVLALALAAGPAAAGEPPLAEW